MPNFVAALSDPLIPPSALPRFDALVAASAASTVVREQLRSQQKLALEESDVDELAGDIERLVRVFAKLHSCLPVSIRPDRWCQIQQPQSAPNKQMSSWRRRALRYGTGGRSFSFNIGPCL